jgi:hypothetical protein
VNVLPTTTFCLLLSLASALAQAPGGDWKPFSPKNGMFGVLLPGTPTDSKKSIKTPTGVAELALFEVAVPSGNGKYFICCTEYPEASIKAGTEDKRLESARDALVASSKGKLKREKTILLGEYPGRELQIEVEGMATMVIRTYAVKNRLYVVGAAGSAGMVTSKDTLKFLESFKLVK